MERHFYIKGTSKEIEFLSLYSKVSTPKIWGKEIFSDYDEAGNLYKFEVTMRIPEEVKIESGRTYTFRNYLKRTGDMALLDLLEKFKQLLTEYRMA